MSRKKIIRNNKTERPRREKDPIPWRYCLTTLACGLFLVVGFFGAARQHFSSIDYGIKNSRLRKQVEKLETQQRSLLINKEVALSPGEIKKSAKKIGLTGITASNIESFRTQDEKPIQTAADKSLVKKTVETKPSKEPATAEKPKNAVKPDKEIKKEIKPVENRSRLKSAK